MAHPMHADVKDAINKKLHHYTSDYGSAPNPSGNVPAPGEMAEGQQNDHTGFGADGTLPKARGDRPARKTKAANPIATYATGGAVNRARGGRTKKGSTHVNVIVAPQGGAPGAAMGGPMPGAPPPGMPPAMPPRPPMAPPPMGGPPGMMPPGGMPPGGPPGMPMRAKGGAVKPGPTGTQPAKPLPKKASGGQVSSEDDQDKVDRVKEGLKSEGLVRERKRGGHVYTAGAASGPGREEKIEAYGKKASHGKPQTV